MPEVEVSWFAGAGPLRVTETYQWIDQGFTENKQIESPGPSQRLTKKLYRLT